MINIMTPYNTEAVLPQASRGFRTRQSELFCRDLSVLPLRRTIDDA
jgi:hypothetical protein